MNRREKADRIGEILDRLYPEPPIPLDHRDPFTLLVSVMLSAQTTDKKVNQVTPALFAKAPDAASMAAMPVDQILALIRTVGLAPTKAKNLKEMARLLIEKHGGAVPDDIDALEALPGVGHKTASVVICQAFGRPAALGSLQWEERGEDGGRSQEGLSRGHLESPSPPDHLFRSRALPGSRSRSRPLRNLRLGGDEEANCRGIPSTLSLGTGREGRADPYWAQ